MKKSVYLWMCALVLTMTLPMAASAQDETVLETQHSGCLGNTRGYMDEWVPAIVLEKDGNILTVEVQNYISNCATSDFVAKSSISDGSDGEPLTLSAEVQPVLGHILAYCLCPFNVTFTVRDLEANTFYLNCEWYQGLVELTEGEPLVLKKEDYESLLSESKVWTMAYKATVNPEEYGDVYYLKDTKLVGDTIINDIHFKQKYCREWQLGEEIPAEWNATDNYLGQDGGKIYLYSDKNKMMVEDMDMSLNVGDKTTSYYQYDEDKEEPLCFVATAVSDTILNNTDVIKPRKSTHVKLEDYPADIDIWIDGIGSVTQGIDGLGLFQSTGAIPKLYRVTDGDAVIYQSTLPASWVYRPLVEKGKKWTCHHNDTNLFIYDYFYTLEGDTVVAGKDCLKMYSENKDNTGAVVYEGALYEEDKKVYCFYPEKDEAELLYDFGCKVGDKLSRNSYEQILLSAETIEVNGRHAKRYEFQAQMSSEEDDPFVMGRIVWIEGVGSTNDFFKMLPLAGNYNFLKACEVNSEVIYQNLDLINDIMTIRQEMTPGNIIYDLQGRRLNSPQKGINIIRQSDGTMKKVIVK